MQTGNGSLDTRLHGALGLKPYVAFCVLGQALQPLKLTVVVHGFRTQALRIATGPPQSHSLPCQTSDLGSGACPDRQPPARPLKAG